MPQDTISYHNMAWHTMIHSHFGSSAALGELPAPMSLYSVLGVSPDATKDEIRVAYKRQALAAHPDKGGCAEAFHAVTRAFEMLYDAAARERYDGRLARARRPAGAQPERGRSKGSDWAAHGRRPTCSATRTAARSAAATATASKQAPPCPRSATGARPRGMQPSGEGPATASGSGAAGPPPEALVPARDRRARRQSRKWSACGGSTKERCAAICERLRELLQRLSPAARRRALEDRFSHAQRRMLEQWMRTQSSAPSRNAAGHRRSCGNTRTRASTALVAVPSSRDSCCSSCSSGTESSEEADDVRLALDDEVQVAREEPRSSDEESVEAELEEEQQQQEQQEQEQEEEEDEEEAATRHEAASEEGRIRYVIKHKHTGCYCSRICADGLVFSSRYTQDLATVLDFVVALMAIRERMPPAEVRESYIKPVILEILEEHGFNAARDIGLKVCLILPFQHFFVGPSPLRVPFVPFDRIGDVMSIWCQTAGRFASMHRHRRFGPKWTFFHVHDPVTAADMWSAIRQSYTDSWVAAGRDAQHVADRLDAQYAARRAHRERQLETWNKLRMASEDRHISLRAEHRLRRQECRAMASEDQRRRLRRTPQGIAEELDSRLLRRVLQWLRRLGQVERQLERQAAAARAKESRQEAEALAAAKRARCQEEASERAAQRARREERWRWMNRRDITVGEMLQGQGEA